MLIIVKNRDRTARLQRCFNLEAGRRADVFNVDAAERVRDTGDGVDEGLRRIRVHLDIEAVNIGEALEQQSLALHHRLARQSPEVPKPENGRTVGYDPHKVALVGVVVGELRRLGNCAHGLRDARAVGQGQIAAGIGGLVHLRTDFSRAGLSVIGQRGAAQFVVRHDLTF